MTAGYYRFPTIHDDTVVFVAEDDLWRVPAGGGIAHRLTAGLGEVTYPALSSDGRELAFVGREEGEAEVYTMPADGGPAQRITYLGDNACRTLGWTADNKIIFASSVGQPFSSLLHLYTIEPDGTEMAEVNVGPATAFSRGPDGGVVIGRNNRSPARWKRYRGGTAGQIWIDEQGNGKFRPLLAIKGNLDRPMWLDGRIYFLSDHEGIGNLYSCLPTGEDLQRHTDHKEFYARNASSDGRRIVYHAGADLYLYDPENGRNTQIDVDFHAPRTQRNRKFVAAEKYLQSWEVHPDGHAIAITTRGKPFTFANWEGAVVQHGAAHGVRYRLLTWLNDGQRLLAVTDAEGEESFVIFHDEDNSGTMTADVLTGLDIGRPTALAVNPKKDQVLFSNHRYELLCLDLESRELTQIDRGKATRIRGFAWSPDGEWAAYNVSISLQVSMLRLWRASDGEIFPLTRPVLHDVVPAFDPEGKYLYFLSYREFDPVYDNLHFDLNFPRGVRPYLVTLQRDLPSPFIPVPRAPGKNGNDKAAAKPNKSDAEGEDDGEQAEEKSETVRVDVEGIDRRIVAFPVEEGRYGRILGLKDGKVLYSRYPVEGALNQSWASGTPDAKGSLYLYDFSEQKEERLVSGITDFDLSRDAGTLLYRAGNRLRVLKAGSKPDDNGSEPGRKSGWIDLGRVKVSVIPEQEWQQMFREAWRLQRDQFWTPDMSQVDWQAVYERYRPLVDRVGSRAEFSDLIWEMQGELGTSHTYELGGDYRPQPRYVQGYLGADFDYDASTGSWRITHIVQGDVWDEEYGSPLARPGVNVSVGDRLLAINGRRLTEAFTPAMALVNQAEQEVTLTIAPPESSNDTAPRSVVVKTLGDDMPARYREWVEDNRRHVHESTDGRVGYVHIPDMGARGYAEFHRGYLAEVDREGLIVDVRFNGGGHVSQLILEKLSRRRIGYDVSRWGQAPSPYPAESVLGPVVALTNEYAGSDGDIFSHGFKLMNLGPLLGKRTWGGVIGINPRQRLVDNTLTTQPEFSFWFEDVGWGVENYGTDPDIEVDNTPQDYIHGEDAQLERAISEALRLLEENPPTIPDFDKRPNLALPQLPPR